MKKYLNKHLDDINETYLQHLMHAARFSLTMGIGCLVCLIHAICPFLFEKTGSEIIKKMHHDMVTHRSTLTMHPAVNEQSVESI